MERLNHEQRALADAALTNRLNVIHHVYVDIAGDLIAGALLGQILYWFGDGKDGTSRAKIRKDGYTWIAKTRNDWHEEIRISPKQYDRASKILRDKGLIEVRTYKFAGNPTTHIRVIHEALNAAVDAWKVEQVKAMLTDGEEPGAAGYSPMVNNEMPHTGTSLLTDGEQRYSPLGKNDVDQRGISLTETTAENTKESTAETHTPTAAPSESAPLSNDLVSHQAVKDQIESDFTACWAEYPRKEGKQKARRAFERAVRRGSVTAAQILAEVVLFRQYCERRIADGDLERRYIPTGGAWFDDERWNDDIPSISSSFDDFLVASNHNRAVAEIRRSAARGDILRVREIMAQLPY